MPKRDPRVTAYIRGRAPFARPILRRLRVLLHEAGPDLEESVRWGMPGFLHDGRIICGFAGFKAHCALWFWKGTRVVGKKPRGAMGQFGRITGLADLPSKSKLRSYVRKAIGLRGPLKRRNV